MLNLNKLTVRNFRSLRDISVPIGNLCVITGGNGTGKSNLYKTLSLVQKSAQGQFARTVNQDGGMPSLLWAGARSYKDKKQFRMSIELDLGPWRYSLAAGLPTVNEGAFPLDPRLKEETLFFTADERADVAFMKRSKMSVQLRDADNKMQTLAFEIIGNESALSQISEPAIYPEISRIRDWINGWRFYHHFDTSKGSVLRQQQIGSMTPLLASDGHDLPSALASINELGDMAGLAHHFGLAFEGHKLIILEDKGRFSFEIDQPGLLRNLRPEEISDGTLRYLCLLAVLKGLRLPTLLVLNEPETSLHHDLLEPLADLIVEAAGETQVVVVTHSEVLARRVEEQTGELPTMLVKETGATKVTV